MIQVEGPNGVVVEFPDGTPPETIKSVMQKALGSSAPKAPGLWDGINRMRDQGLTLGFADEIAGVSSGVARGVPALFDADKSFVDEFGKGYSERVASERSANEAFREANPVIATGVEILGGLVTGGGAAAGASRAVGSAVPSLAKYAGTGAAAGGVAGAGYADGESRIEGAVGGAAAGAVVGAGLPLAGRVVGKTLMTAAQPVLDRVGKGPQTAAERKLLEAIERDGKTPEQVQARLRTLGPNATIADAAGENTVGLVETAANQPGYGRQLANRVLQQRQKGQGDRIMESASRELGDAGFYQTIDELNAARKQAAAPLYEQAYAREFVANDTVTELLNRPSMRQALGRAYRIAAEEGRDPMGLGLQMNEAGDVVFTRAPSMQTLDYVKRGLDDVVEQFRDPVTGRLRLDESGRAINNTRAAFVNELRRANPEYAAALDAWAGPSKILDAVNLGRGFAKPDSEITERVVSQMTQAERDGFLLGVRKGIEDVVDRTGQTADAVRKLIGTPKMQKALQAAFPDQASYRRFAADLMREAAFNRTRNTALPGSQTARRLAAQADQGVDPSPLVDAVQGNFGTAATGAARNIWARLTEMPEQQRDALARMLLSTDERMNTEALRRLTMKSSPPQATIEQRQALASMLSALSAQQLSAAANR